MLGEPLLLTIEVRSTQDANIEPIKLDSIPHFEFLKKDSIIKSNENGIFVLRQLYRITSFDSGKWVIPPIPLRPNVKTPSILVEVGYTDSFDPTKPYHDVQDIKDVPFVMQPQYEKWWYPVALLLIILTIVVHWLTGPKKEKTKIPKPTEAPFDKARRRLRQLKNSASITGEYQELIEIFRTYIKEKTGIESLHQTSNNLILKLDVVFSDKSKYKNISKILHLADFVKFAKYQPDKEELGSAKKIIEDAVQHIENKYEKPFINNNSENIERTKHK
ncbi:MAG: hypothetical protein IPH58_04565 [Sphingobacteriales bacterium]|nr:hypothetical protein [Sphingobacteriales bacterium]